ncbi:hypothetical protein JCM30760_21040 [Thiomicrorhabdus hydrogeniphila]
MSDFNKAEMTQMHIVHDVMSQENMLSFEQSPSTNTHNQMALMDCCDDTMMQGDSCHNFFCQSFHVTSYFYPSTLQVNNTSTKFDFDIPTNIEIIYSNSQPETPPPLA